jgi:hypothetical protein
MASRYERIKSPRFSIPDRPAIAGLTAVPGYGPGCPPDRGGHSPNAHGCSVGSSTTSASSACSLWTRGQCGASGRSCRRTGAIAGTDRFRSDRTPAQLRNVGGSAGRSGLDFAFCRLPLRSCCFRGAEVQERSVGGCPRSRLSSRAASTAPLILPWGFVDVQALQITRFRGW